MKCSRCRHDNPPGGRFCGRCGAPLSGACDACGAPNPPENRYCGQCGAALATQGGPRARDAGAAPPSYAPRQLAQKILTTRAALAGERKRVTVMFADLKDSMELLADRDPEEAHALLDPVVERMMEAVHRYEGTVCEVRGDGVMALFGAPHAHEDHALRACYAALDMQSAIRLYDDAVRRSHGIKARIRIGLNSGEVVVRAIGSDLRMDYAAVGETTHLAGRMEQLASPGTVLMTASTLRLVEGFVETRPLGPVPVKGLDEPVEVHELTGVLAVRTRLQAAAARGLTNFVGRDLELDQIRAALARAKDGRGQVVAVVGEAGVGKSRLVWEVIHSDCVRGWRVVQSSSVSYGKAAAYLPAIELLRDYFQLDVQDEPRRIRELVTGKVLTLDRALEASLPALLWLLDVPVEDEGWTTLDARQRRRQALDSVRRMLVRESEVQPLVVVFEDLHWIDSETQALLDGLVESVPSAAMVLLVNYRPEVAHGWGTRTYYTQLRIDPLTRESAAGLLDALLGSDPSLDVLKGLLFDRTEGNPFFLEESVRALAETGELAGGRGDYRLVGSADAIRIPATVQTVLAARIDRLPDEEKRLLETAAVVGKDVPIALLRPLVEQDEASLREALAHLQATEFLYETTLFPDLVYTFKHALTHEVAYGTLLGEQRRAIHGRIVDLIETVYADRLTEQVERLAHHSVRAERWDRAVEHLRQAGARAVARSTYREAAGHLEQALVALDHLPRSPGVVGQAIDLRFGLRSTLQALGDHARVLEHLRAAERLAAGLGDQDRLGWASAYLVQYLWRTGEAGAAERLGKRALAIAAVLDDFALDVVTTFFIGQGRFILGEYARAAEHLRRNVAALHGDRLHDRLGLTGLPAVLARIWLSWSLAERGEFVEATNVSEEGLSIAQASGQAYSIAAALLGVGQVQMLRGTYSSAVPALARAADLCESRDLVVIFPVTVALLGSAYANSGRIDEAVLMLGRDEATMPDLSIFDTPSARVARAEVCLLGGRLDEAADRAESCGFHGRRATAMELQGAICACRDPPCIEQGIGYYRQSLAIAEQLHMRPLVARCHHGLGNLLARAERSEAGHEYLRLAAGMYDEMGMARHLERVRSSLSTS